MDELIGLFMGWGIPFLVCLDDDKEGRSAQKKYIESWGISENKVWTLKTVDEELSNKEICGFLEEDDFELIKSHYGIAKVPTKSQVQLFFSEHLATKTKVGLSKAFEKRIAEFEKKISEAFATL